MLRISKLADYGTVIMAYMAKNVDELVSARDISENTRLALPTVSKLLKKLSQANLLVSVRGATGGYKLRKDAESITLADVIYALDDTRGLTECSDESSACILQSRCAMQKNWQLVSKAIYAALSSVSLADLQNPFLQIDYKFGVNCGKK
jgi:FeS assembly SUF system regulator